MKNFSGNYYIGLDIGTNSVGWAVMNEDFSLCKKSGKHMWGSRLFDDAKSAEATRLLRSSRRRYERRKERIRLLQMLMDDLVSTVDPGFFKRMEKSFLLNVKNDPEFGRDNVFNLFEGAYTDKDYYSKYKTIYHLRRELCVNAEKADIRLIYLALHHIIKYRGNFLHEEDFSLSKDGATKLLEDFITKYNNEVFVNEDGEIAHFLEDVSTADICNVLSDDTLRKKLKQEKLGELWKGKDYHKKADELIKALLGYKANFALIFDVDIPEDKKSGDYSFSFSADDYEEKALTFDELFGEEVSF